ncbi:MAG: DUF1476 domain-containing protein [Alphaproteobacteria bacterium]
MSGFDKREKDEETKFKHDQELQFKVMSRRNKLLGLWAANLMGLSGQAANDYAITVVHADVEEAGEEDVVRKVLADFAAKGADVDEHKVRKRMAELMHEAKRQVMTD